MAGKTRIAVALTPDLALLPVVDAVVAGVAAHLGFRKDRQENLQRGVEKVCRRLMEGMKTSNEREIRLNLAGFSDRMEVVLEDELSLEPSAKESLLHNELVDRVSVEETEDGRVRMTLVHYLRKP